MTRDPHYILRRAADAIVIVPVGRAAAEFPGMVTVNETGALLWELLERERTEEELAAALCKRFDVEPERAAADVSAFLEKLRRAGALKEERSGAVPRTKGACGA